ncbi:hypothetical protein B4U79_13403 [Dinothrombium tinctorium]|uniref:Uncharacterized protein n=2 Tax=Dinothrombium tinctorium TaxID=1965070 RepID=A0A3S3P944_9ACAR|nr:hypothetical protein B4U79_07699 [Dinothrombium tinctorium]RWS07907.1 hypothetical protein B4U79_13403 [Dinothrombium tinctorium]
MFPIVYRGNLYRATPRPQSPPKPQPRIVIDEHITPNTQFTFVDFVPSYCKNLGGKMIYHTFSALMQLANEWLNKNPYWKIISCETIHKYNAQNGFKAVVKILRIWIQRLGADAFHYETLLSYRDFKPKRKADHSLECLDDLIGDVNIAILHGQINGQILSIEAIECQATEDWRFDPEETYCNDGVTFRDMYKYKNYVTVIRVYYQRGMARMEEIGIADFVPQNVSLLNVRSKECERFSSLVKRASYWLGLNPELTLIKAQSMDRYFSDTTFEVDTRSMCRTIEKTKPEIRFLRLYFKKKIDFKERSEHEVETASLISLPPPPPVFLASTAFWSKKCEEPLNDWFMGMSMFQEDRYKCKLLCVETSVVPTFINDRKNESFAKAVDEVLNCNRLEGRYRYTFTAIKLYFDEGYYNSLEDNLRITEDYKQLLVDMP